MDICQIFENWIFGQKTDVWNSVVPTFLFEKNQYIFFRFFWPLWNLKLGNYLGGCIHYSKHFFDIWFFYHDMQWRRWIFPQSLFVSMYFANNFFLNFLNFFLSWDKGNVKKKIIICTLFQTSFFVPKKCNLWKTKYWILFIVPNRQNYLFYFFSILLFIIFLLFHYYFFKIFFFSFLFFFFFF